MKHLIFPALALLFLAPHAQAGGLGRVHCQSENAEITIFHFGLPHTIAYVEARLYGTNPVSIPVEEFKIYRPNASVTVETPKGLRRLCLYGLFDVDGNVAYPVPRFELQTRILNYFVPIEHGKCEVL